MPKDNRYTVAFDPAADAAVQHAMATTHYKTVPDLVRAAVAVFIDLLDVNQRKMEIVLRDSSTELEWSYSPHNPGRALPIISPEPAGGSKVLRPSFPRAVDNHVKIGVAATEPSDEGRQNSQPRQPARKR